MKKLQRKKLFDNFKLGSFIDEEKVKATGKWYKS